MSGLSEPGQRNAGCQCAEIHLQGSGDKRCLGGIQRDPVEAQQLAGLLLQHVSASAAAESSAARVASGESGRARVGDEMRQLTPRQHRATRTSVPAAAARAGRSCPSSCLAGPEGGYRTGQPHRLGGGELAQEMRVTGQRVAVGQCRQATGTAGVEDASTGRRRG